MIWEKLCAYLITPSELARSARDQPAARLPLARPHDCHQFSRKPPLSLWKQMTPKGREHSSDQITLVLLTTIPRSAARSHSPSFRERQADTVSSHPRVRWQSVLSTHSCHSRKRKLRCLSRLTAVNGNDARMAFYKTNKGPKKRSLGVSH